MMQRHHGKHMRELSFSDYIVYVDESGDTDMCNINPAYPVFVLTFCIVSKKDYREYITSRIQALKYEFFGHDMVNLHAYDIRQKENDFAFLAEKNISDDFFNHLNEIMEKSFYILVCSVIKKDVYAQRDSERASTRNIYHIALQFCMERLHDFLVMRNQHGRLTHVVAESRGKKEDGELREEFNKILENIYDYKRRHRRPYAETPMKIKFASKEANSTGLQMADLIGHPIGCHAAFPERGNRAFEILENKLLRKGPQRIGLKIFP